MKAQQIWFTKPHSIEIRENNLRALKPNEVLVRSLYSAISAGTEMLVYNGEIPNDMTLDMNLESFKDQETSYPLQYGYATVGRIENIGRDLDKTLIDKLIFAYEPHSSHFITKINQTIPLPEGVNPLAAVFLANMETAVNLILDGTPCLGEHVIVLGQGVVGLLVSALLTKSSILDLYALDPINKRRISGKQLGINKMFDPNNHQDLNKLKRDLHTNSMGLGADLIYELSGSPETLNLAIELCGYSSRIVIGSWYGKKSSTLLLGDNFHRNRIQIMSSQVSTIAPKIRGRWNKERRFKTSWQMIREINPEQLITHHIPFDCAASAYQLLHDSPDEALQVILVHPD